MMGNPFFLLCDGRWRAWRLPIALLYVLLLIPCLQVCFFGVEGFFEATGADPTRGEALRTFYGLLWRSCIATCILGVLLAPLYDTLRLWCGREGVNRFNTYLRETLMVLTFSGALLTACASAGTYYGMLAHQGKLAPLAGSDAATIIARCLPPSALPYLYGPCHAYIHPSQGK